MSHSLSPLLTFSYCSAGWTDKLAGESSTEANGACKVLYGSIDTRCTVLTKVQIVQYDPIGVCAGIGAWKASPAFFGFKVAPAMAVGCTFIYQGSEKSPIGLLGLGDLIKEAGFPPGEPYFVFESYESY